MDILGFDVEKAFTPDVSLFEMFVRGSLMYVALFVLLRVVLRSKSGQIAFTDLLVIVLIADAAQNAMASDYSSITDGLMLVATLVFWAFAIDWLGYRVSWVRRIAHPDAKPLVQDGRLVEKHLAEELMTREELMTQLRLNGTDKLSDVRVAYMEGNGQVSVLKRDDKAGSDTKANQAGAPGAG